MRVVRSLQEWAHDSAVSQGLHSPLQMNTGVCTICGVTRGRAFMTKGEICTRESCLRQRDEESPNSFTRAGDCIVDPCKIMRCIHCPLEWGCRRGCVDGRVGVTVNKAVLSHDM